MSRSYARLPLVVGITACKGCSGRGAKSAFLLSRWSRLGLGLGEGRGVPVLLRPSRQVFPDEFHLAALEPFLEGVCRLKEKVRVRPILESLMERIGKYVEEHPDTLPRDVSHGRWAWRASG